MDGTREGKVFAPGYGEFSTGTAGGDLEAVSLASPTDSRQGPAPAEFAALSGAVDSVYQATAAEDADRLNEAAAALGQAWEAALTKGIPPQMESQMKVDIDALNSAAGGEDWESAQSAALRIAQNELDLRLLYQRVIDVDLARLKLWTASFRSTSRPKMRVWCWPMWQRWTGCGSAPGTGSSRPGRGRRAAGAAPGRRR